MAKSLEIKELCHAKTETKGEQDHKPLPSDPVKSTETLEEQTVTSHHFKRQAQTENRRKVASMNDKNQCEVCQKSFYDSAGLRKHDRSVHQLVRFSCDQCNIQFTQQSSLTKHIQSKHEGIKYSCDQCAYQATTQSSLTRHIQTRH